MIDDVIVGCPATTSAIVRLDYSVGSGDDESPVEPSSSPSAELVSPSAEVAPPSVGLVSPSFGLVGVF